MSIFRGVWNSRQARYWKRHTTLRSHTDGGWQMTASSPTMHCCSPLHESTSPLTEISCHLPSYIISVLTGACHQSKLIDFYQNRENIQNTSEHTEFTFLLIKFRVLKNERVSLVYNKQNMCFCFLTDEGSISSNTVCVKYIYTRYTQLIHNSSSVIFSSKWKRATIVPKKNSHLHIFAWVKYSSTQDVWNYTQIYKVHSEYTVKSASGATLWTLPMHDGKVSDVLIFCLLPFQLWKCFYRAANCSMRQKLSLLVPRRDWSITAGQIHTSNFTEK